MCKKSFWVKSLWVKSSSMCKKIWVKEYLGEMYVQESFWVLWVQEEFLGEKYMG